MRKILLFLTVFCLLTALGCSKNNESKTAADAAADDENEHKLDTLQIDTSVLDCEKIDINNDGKIDQTIYSKDGVLQVVIRDLNFDGVTDMTEFYKDGVHYRDEIDLDFDAKCDLIVTYENEKPVKKEFSHDFEENQHGTQFFDTKGNRTEIRRDNDSDGDYDVIEYYHPGEDEPYKVENIDSPELSN